MAIVEPSVEDEHCVRSPVRRDDRLTLAVIFGRDPPVPARKADGAIRAAPVAVLPPMAERAAHRREYVARRRPPTEVPESRNAAHGAFIGSILRGKSTSWLRAARRHELAALLAGGSAACVAGRTSADEVGAEIGGDSAPMTVGTSCVTRGNV